MNDLEYIFDKDLIVAKGIPNAEGYVKNIFKEFLTRPQEQNDIFEVIWNNNTGANGGLRENIFPIANYPNMTDAQYKNAAKLDFATLISNTSNSFYNFIKVK